MGTRYFLEVTCPKCGFHDDDVYYAPTCGFDTWICLQCHHEVDLEELTGISYEDASNIDLIEEIVQKFAQKETHGCGFAGSMPDVEELCREELECQDEESESS